MSVTALAAGGSHTCALSSTSGAYCWGDNGDGQLGTGSTTSRSTPVAVSGGLSFSTLATGNFHSCGLISSGAGYCWGWNYYGQLGRGTFAGYSTVPVAVAPFTASVLGSAVLMPVGPIPGPPPQRGENAERPMKTR